MAIVTRGGSITHRAGASCGIVWAINSGRGSTLFRPIRRWRTSSWISCIEACVTASTAVYNSPVCAPNSVAVSAVKKRAFHNLARMESMVRVCFLPPSCQTSSTSTTGPRDVARRGTHLVQRRNLVPHSRRLVQNNDGRQRGSGLADQAFSGEVQCVPT